MSTRLSMTRGDTKVVRFTCSNLPAAGLTGFSFWFTAKNLFTDADGSAQFQKIGTPVAMGPFQIVTNGSDTVSGVVICTLSPADTSNLPDYEVELQWDFQVEDSDGNISTADSGVLVVEPDVTRAA